MARQPSNAAPAVALVLTTFDAEEKAASVVRTLVEERVAACGTLLPAARSIYPWQGKIEEATEVVVLLKTDPSLLDRLCARLKALHPYETPEILAGGAHCANGDYASWLRAWLSPAE